MEDTEKERKHQIDELAQCRRRAEELEVKARLIEKGAQHIEALFQKQTFKLDKITKALQLGVGGDRLAKEAHSHLASVMDNVDEAIIGKTLEGVITSWNAGAQRIFGYSAKEAVGQSITLLFPPELYDEEQVILKRVKEQGLIENYETTRRTKDGRYIAVSITASPMYDLSGKMVGISSIKRDITKRKQAEARLQAYMMMLEQSNQALQEFAYVASHDMNEPLRKVQAFGKRLKEKYGHLLEGESKLYLERMLNATERMKSLLESLLDYSRVTMKAQPFVQVNLADLVKEVLQDLEVSIQRSGGRVEVGFLPELEADPTQMRQLFQNLIGNALKFHKEGVKPQVLVSSELGDPTSLELTVSDNGIGFDMEDLEKVFSPFERLEGRSRNYEGSGMGLAICKKIVERHGGSITAKSRPDEGSTFIVTLPVKGA